MVHLAVHHGHGTGRGRLCSQKAPHNRSRDLSRMEDVTKAHEDNHIGKVTHHVAAWNRVGRLSSIQG